MKDLIERLRATGIGNPLPWDEARKAADALEAHMELVKKWQGLCEAAQYVAESVQQRAEAQAKEIEALRADADRYRWLRTQNAIDWDAFPFPAGYEHPDEVLDSYPMMLEAAIDAARRK